MNLIEGTLACMALIVIAAMICVEIQSGVIITNASVYSESGVEVYYASHGGWEKTAEGLERVVNTNDVPVVIKCVWQFEGETTKWVKVFTPGMVYPMDVSHRHGFYIYHENGVSLIGFVSIQ